MKKDEIPRRILLACVCMIMLAGSISSVVADNSYNVKVGSYTVSYQLTSPITYSADWYPKADYYEYEVKLGAYDPTLNKTDPNVAYPAKMVINYDKGMNYSLFRVEDAVQINTIAAVKRFGVNRSDISTHYQQIDGRPGEYLVIKVKSRNLTAYFAEYFWDKHTRVSIFARDWVVFQELLKNEKVNQIQD